MAKINFTVQGLTAKGAQAAAARAEILRTLDEYRIGQAGFEPGLETFSVEIDPAVHSFSDVRRAIGALGKSKGLVYLAVVMSP